MDTMQKHTEFETKYRLEGDKVFEFKQLVESIGEPYDFIYVQGPDWYYTKPDGSFLRYRRAENDKSNRAELTMKTKPDGAGHNVIRKEINLRVDKNKFCTVEEFAKMLGYDFNFKIWKMCHIYNFKDATLVFYTVRDDKGLMTHFVEIELDEDNIHKLTKDEAWNVIRKYERILAPIGITHRHRLNKSLYEMYVKDIYNNKPEPNDFDGLNIEVINR
jgi:adenylate cyclase class IV